MFELMNFPFTDLWNDFDRHFYHNSDSALHPFRTDIIDKGDRYELAAELPGFDKKDITVSLKDNALTIHAEKKEETSDENTENKYISHERCFGVYERTFRADGIRPEDISAQYENGVLLLDFKKPEEKKPENRMIEIQ